MAPIKFEDNIREKLQNREIQPSRDAWNKLDTALGKPPKRKSSPRTWLAITASFLILFFVGRSIFQGNQVQMEVAEESVEIVDPQEVDDQQPLIDQLTENVVEEKQLEIASEEKPGEEQTPLKVQTKAMPIPVQAQEEMKTVDAIAKIEEPEDKITPGQEVETDLTNDLFVTDKVDEVVAQVQALQRENSTVSPEEVEALLDAAQREISNRKLLAEGAKVDPMALLNDVESEMERSFRDKVFDALGDGFDKVRTAVAERNN